ncbi:MAG: hypothetical protein LV481_14450 [Methylacidiphilales bacterium]|nr:hypothetical protein [Candidatus Methylacidiphilales bacterium]
MPVPFFASTSPSPPGTSDLGGGANMKWDVSRRYSFPISNPASIPRGKFTSGFGTIYSQAIPSGNAVSLPSNPLIGNDDASTADEDDNPYAACTTTNLTHAIGQITSLDRPTLWMPNAGGSEGNTLEQSFLMQEFVRVQIGSSWYVISDPLLWKEVENLTFHSGQWQDNGSLLGAGN